MDAKGQLGMITYEVGPAAAASRAWYATITGKPAHGAYPEDFSFFAQEVPGFYFTVGAVKPGTTSGGHHTPTFLADDAAVPVGMR